MISTITTSLHALAATLIFSAAVLIFLAGPRDPKNRAVASILILYSLAGIAFGLGVNSISIQQATPWIVVELVATYSSAPAALLVALTLLRPKVAKNPYVFISIWVFILLPPVLCLLDLAKISQTFLSSPILLSLEKMTDMYSGGYILIEDVTTAFGNNFLLFELIFFYTVWIFYPNLYAFIKDRKTDRSNSLNALVLFLTAVVGGLVNTVLRSQLPITIAPLITSTIISFGFFIAGIRRIRNTGLVGVSDSWLQDILRNYPMFTKLATTIGLIVVPTIIFITFSSFSFFQNSLLSVANDNLMVISHHGADSIIEHLNEEFHSIEHLNESRRLGVLLANRMEEYQNFYDDQINQTLNENNELWLQRDDSLLSSTLDPVNNHELNSLIEENPNYINIILVDSHGGLVTASENPQKYNFSTDPSWLYVAENLKPSIGNPTWNNEIQGYVIKFATPLHNQADELVGVTIGELNVTELITDLQKFEQNNIKFGLADSQGHIVPSNGIQSAEFDVPIFLLNSMMGNQELAIFQIEEQSFLVRSSQVTSQDFEFTAPWRVAAFQPVSQALAPLRTATVTAAATAGIIIAISTLIIISLSQSISRPLRKLTDAAKQILEGETKINLQMNTSDEIGTLASSFNQMSTDLNTLLNTLEGTIDERTRDLRRRAVQLEASAVVAQQAAGVRDVTSLLELVVELIPEKFDYYHAGIFLLDEFNRFAVLQAANSEGGKRMLARNHKLQVGRVGVVGYVAGMGLPRIAQDVGSDVVYYDNPDMPETRSEMALPLKVRDQVIGVLDVQSKEANAFTQEDIDVLQVLADQLALAIDNARLFENSRKALEELQTLYGQDTAKAWRQRLTGREISFAYDSTGLTREITKDEPMQEDHQALLSKPISLRGQVIGNLSFIRDGLDMEWSEDETILIDEILEQTALALENARLVNQIRLRSDQIQLLQEITSLAASILNEKELLDNVAQKLQSSLQIAHCGIALIDESSKYVKLVASATSELKPIKIGNQILVNEDGLTELVLQNPRIQTLQQINNNLNYKLFVESFTSKQDVSVTLIPLIIRDQVIGYIFLENEDKKRTTDVEEENLFLQIGVQISTALESARLFSAEQEGRLAAAALLEITQIASASLDMNQVLNQATNRSAQAIQAHRCTIFLLDEKEKIKPLVSIYADGSEMTGAEWELLQKRVRETYEHYPLHRLAANLRTPKIISSPSTYANLPLYWAEDFQIENMLMVPLISQNKVIGSMIFDQIDPNLKFRQNQEELAQTIAGQIATTIENANLFEQAVHRAERERKVTEITAKIRSSNDPKEILETAITELRMALAHPAGKSKRRAASQQITKTEIEAPSNGKDDTQNK